MHDVWTAGDGCPSSHTRIRQLYAEKVKPVFENYKRGDGDIGLRRSHKSTSNEKKTPAVPKRKSLRLTSPAAIAETDPCPPSQNISSIPESEASKRGSSRQSPMNPRYLKWMSDHGNLLFDVFSVEQMVKTRKKGMRLILSFMKTRKM